MKNLLFLCSIFLFFSCSTLSNNNASVEEFNKNFKKGELSTDFKKVENNRADQRL